MLVMSHVRKLVYALMEQGVHNRAKINRLVGYGTHDQAADLAQLLQLANDKSLHLLRNAIDKNRLVRQAYSATNPDGSASGCLVNHLFGFGSHAEFFHWNIPDETLFAVNRVMRDWDFERIEAHVVREAIVAELEKRAVEQASSLLPPPPYASPDAVNLQFPTPL